MVPSSKVADYEIGFQSFTEEFNTSRPGAKLLFHITGAIAEFERHIIRERTPFGLKAIRVNCASVV